MEHRTAIPPRDGWDLRLLSQRPPGHTPALIESTGAALWQGTSTAFGEFVEEHGEVDNPFRFPGQYYDRETGVNCNLFRDDDPEAVRYTTSDPDGFIDGLNS